VLIPKQAQEFAFMQHPDFAFCAHFPPTASVDSSPRMFNIVDM
jgi:hypothetical protein